MKGAESRGLLGTASGLGVRRRSCQAPRAEAGAAWSMVGGATGCVERAGAWGRRLVYGVGGASRIERGGRLQISRDAL